jgi:hypothetical protein
MALNEYTAGDKVKLIDPSKPITPVRIGDTAIPGFFAAVYNGKEGAIKYGQVYQVSGKKKLDIVDNDHKPLPTIAKEFINNPVFNTLFKRVQSPNKTDKNED